MRAREIQRIRRLFLVRPLLVQSRLPSGGQSVRHRVLSTIGGACLVLALLPLHANGQHPSHETTNGPWFPFPYAVLGFPPPGYFPGDHVVALRVLVTPREALVFVDGYQAGVVDDFDGAFQRLRLMPGHHEIVVYQAGHRTFRQNLYFNPGSTHTIRHTLDRLLPGEAAEPQPVPRPLPPAPGGAAPPFPVDPSRMGALSLRIQPHDATVLLNGQRIAVENSTTSAGGPSTVEGWVLVPLPVGPHHLRIEKPGFQPFAVDVDIRPRETASLNVNLEVQ
jgi:hypothetical protein